MENRVQALSSIQPGLGAIMHEYGNRFTNMYFAANGDNWGLAQYELKEMLEAQEIAEITLNFSLKTRPAYEEKKEYK